VQNRGARPIFFAAAAETLLFCILFLREQEATLQIPVMKLLEIFSAPSSATTAQCSSFGPLRDSCISQQQNSAPLSVEKQATF
jgi:hypothetical protein